MKFQPGDLVRSNRGQALNPHKPIVFRVIGPTKGAEYFEGGIAERGYLVQDLSPYGHDYCYAYPEEELELVPA